MGDPVEVGQSATNSSFHEIGSPEGGDEKTVGQDERKVAEKIDWLLKHRIDRRSLRISVAGGSGSGKSTVCGLIRQALHPIVTEIIPLDRFFKPVDQLPKYYSQFHHNNQPDFNTPDSLMVGKMVEACREVHLDGVVIFDGHFSLYYPEMRELMDIRCFVDVDLEEMLERRTTRNLAAGYGGSLENIQAYNRECVSLRQEQFIQPTLEYADFVIPNRRSDSQERDNLIRLMCQKIRQEFTTGG
jgi:uridine kinase